MGKRLIYATEEKLSLINEKNRDIMRKFFISKNMNLTESTKKGYESDLNQLWTFLLDRYDNVYLLDMDTEDQADMLEDFVSFCVSVLGNNERRIQRRISCISSLFIYLKKKRKISENACDYLDRPRLSASEKPIIKQTFMTEEQVKQIREHLREHKLLQLETFFNVGMSTMARVNALVNIKLSQIDLENKRINDVLEKEQKIVTLFLSNTAIESINNWLDYRKRNNIESEYLFINTTAKDMGKQISKSTVQSSWIKQIGNIIDVPWLHVHDIRHSASSLAFKRGVPLESVSKILSHSGTDVTIRHYIEMDYDKLQEQKELFDL